jgi:NADPH:quinone reductase-like Zn-dependent oxidoreductase
VYATASSKHHEYLKALGASEVFYYKDKDIVEQIVRAVKKDGVSLDMGYDAVGSMKECMNVLKALNPEGGSNLPSALPLKEDDPKVEGVEVKFVEAPWNSENRDNFFHFAFGQWLKGKLASWEFVPNPNIQVINGSLNNIQHGLDAWKKGVSGLKSCWRSELFTS